MSITFSADEIFEMAIEIERNGAKFYRKAAENASDSETKEFLLEMANMEDAHEATFEEMRQNLSDAEKEETAFDPDGEAALYLQAMADAHGTEGKKSLDDELTGNESMAEVLTIACDAEKNSIVFYTGLRTLVSAKAGRDRIAGHGQEATPNGLRMVIYFGCKPRGLVQAPDARDWRGKGIGGYLSAAQSYGRAAQFPRPDWHEISHRGSVRAV